MKNQFQFFLITSVLLVLVACSGGEQTTGSTFIGGTKGLSLEFLQEVPETIFTPLPTLDETTQNQAIELLIKKLGLFS